MSLEKVSTPEDAGVNSSALKNMLIALEKEEAGNHSIIIIKDDKIAFEKYNAPYDAKYAHSMFSVSKGFVALAIGYLIDEGKLTLDTPILELLPEYKKYKSDKRYERITVKELLTMHSGKKCKFIRHMAKGNYADIFMKASFKNKIDFVYSNDDVYILAKIASDITGQSLVDYLTPRLFQPLGIEKPFWETTRQGIVAGATGLYLKTMDLAKVCYCYLCGGIYEGKQVIPEFWAKNAGKYYVKLPEYYLSSKYYGFYFWGDPYGGYRFDGMFGQFGIVLPKWNAVIALTDCGNREKLVLEEIFKYMPKLFEGKGTENDIAELAESVEKAKIFDIPTKKRNTAAEKELQNKTLRIKHFGFMATCFKIFGFSQSMMPLAIKAAFPKVTWENLNNFKINFNENSCDITWTEGDDVNTIACGMDGKAREDEMTLASFKFKTLSYAYWENENTLKVQIRPIETVGYKNLTFVFGKKSFKLKTDSNPSFDEWALGHMDEVDNTPKFLLKIEEKATKLLLSKTHPTFKGKILNK